MPRNGLYEAGLNERSSTLPSLSPHVVGALAFSRSNEGQGASDARVPGISTAFGPKESCPANDELLEDKLQVLRGSCVLVPTKSRTNEPAPANTGKAANVIARTYLGRWENRVYRLCKVKKVCVSEISHT
jgi:hypothetical protein